MANPPHITDWITAISTFLTAAATGIAALVGIAALKREAKKHHPVIEPTFNHLQGGALSLRAVIRNRLTETLIAESVLIKKPVGMGVAKSSVKGVGRKESTLEELPLRIEIEPAGSSLHGGAFDGSPMNTHTVHLVLFPPEGWVSGVVEIEFRLSSMASTIRDKRIVIKRRITALKATQTDANANKSG